MYEFTNFPKKLELLRTYRGFKTQNSIASTLGIPRQQYSNYATGKTAPGMDMVIKLCNTLKIDINFFLCNGKIEHYDLDMTYQSSEFNHTFIETSVSQKLFHICERARQYAEILVAFITSNSGVTISLWEYCRRNSDCIIIKADDKLKKPLKSNTKLYIIENDYHSDAETLKPLLRSLKNEKKGIVIISRPPLNLER